MCKFPYALITTNTVRTPTRKNGFGCALKGAFARTRLLVMGHVGLNIFLYKQTIGLVIKSFARKPKYAKYTGFAPQS